MAVALRSLPGTRPHYRSYRRSLGAAVVVGLLLVGGLSLAVRLAHARSDMQQGLGQADQARALVSSGAFWKTPHARSTLLGLLRSSEQHFGDARGELALPSWLLGSLSRIPIAGSRIAPAPAAADAGYFATRAASEVIQGVWQHDGGSVPDSGHLLRTLSQAVGAGNADFRSAESDSQRAMLAVNRLPIHSGNAALDQSVATLRKDLPPLRAAAAWLAAAPRILHGGGSRYLLVFQDPEEIRATGGFIGAAGILRVTGSSTTMTVTDSALPHETPVISTPLPEALYTPEGPWIFRDSNWSPDGPTSARLERWFYGEDTGQWVNGVIDVVDSGIVDLLRVTGPVYVPAYQRWVSAGNVESLAQQYVWGTYYGPSHSGTRGQQRKQFFGWVIRAVLPRLRQLPASRWPLLLQALTGAITSRDIVVYDTRAAIENAIRLSDADGSLKPVNGDFLFVVDDNRSYNKIGPYVRESAVYDVTVGADGSLTSTLTLHYRLLPSPSSLVGLGPDAGLWGSKHDYQDFIRVYAPAGARLVSLTGVDRWAPDHAYGLTQFAGRLLLPEGQQRSVTLRYRIPASATSGVPPGQYRLTVRRQAGTGLASVRVTVRGGQGVTLSGTPAPSLTRTVGLSKDAVLTVPLIGEATDEQRPPRVSRLDPYLPYGDFRDRRHPL